MLCILVTFIYKLLLNSGKMTQKKENSEDIGAKAIALLEEIKVEVIELAERALYDPLTGCYRPEVFMELARKEFEFAKRKKSKFERLEAEQTYKGPERRKRTSKPYDFAILYGDIIDFRSINEGQKWHTDGDEALREVGEKSREEIRLTDYAGMKVDRHLSEDGTHYIGRKGGDEFIFLIRDIEGKDDLGIVMERIRKNIDNIKLTSGKKCRIRIGYALFSEGYKSVDDMIIKADQRMYEETPPSQRKT